MNLPDTDLSGKSAIVTGANSGVGLEAARGLARRGARVVMVQRNADKGAAAREALLRDLPGATIDLETIDLASIASIEAGAGRLLAACPRIEFLLNNAGLHDIEGGKTADGFDKTMGTNYVGPFLLTDRLLPRILQTARETGAARIVNTASLAHGLAVNFDADDPFPSPYPRGRDSYAESKLANMLHARALARRFGADGLSAVSAHPGFVASNFGRAEHFPGLWRLAFTLTAPIQISPARGAEPVLFAALGSFAAGQNGAYFTPKGETRAKYRGDPDAMAETLWKRTALALAARGVASIHA